MPADELREGHLPHPNHAPPSRIRNVSAFEVVVELGET